MSFSKKTSVLTVMVALAMSGPAAAGGSHKSTPRQHFDWSAAQPVKVSWTAVKRKKDGLVLRISGRSSYACSPSGFGRSSRCSRK